MSDEPEQPEAPEEEEDLLMLAIRQQLEDHFRLLALVEMLVDEKALKGEEDAIKRELAHRAKDLRETEEFEVRRDAYARLLKAAWNKPPGGGGKPQ